MPDFELEDCHNGSVCGVDEVGRGPLAGPVVAACVVIPPKIRGMEMTASIKDSKKLTGLRRQVLNEFILENCSFAISVIEVETIDRINILQASLKAMSEAISALMKKAQVSHALIDGNRIPTQLPCPASAVVKGDDRSASIAAASIIAKVHRDKIMKRLDADYPQFGWIKNAGYPTPDHLAALERFGVTPHHRRTFGPVKRLLAKSA